MTKRMGWILIGAIVFVGVVLLVAIVANDDGIENIGEKIEELGDDIQDATD